ncbi:MAG: gliding motility-associated C-terminal domain-containing protein [Burkholderiales bacterium]|nr:gliding motility-associated C-terminal domain-containing protein [Bacteroidia bacterium]
MSKIKLFLVFILFLNFYQVFSQGQNCNTATPFCDAPGGAVVQFPNNTNNSAQAGPNYGCLGSQPNPAWFYIKTTVAGNYVFDISQSTGCGPSAGLDVDFIAWGPFTNPLTACNNLTSGAIVDCGFSTSPNEQLNITGAPAGQYYIILLTNFSNSPGCIAFGNVGTNPTDCSITCASVLSGPGIVNYPSTNAGAGTPATPMPSTVSCNSGVLDMYATNLSPFGNPITPALLTTFPNNNNASNSIGWLEGGVPIACFGSGGGCQPLTPNYNMLLQWSYMSPSAVNSFTMCENNTAEPNMAVTVKDLATDVLLPGFTWNDDGSCQTYNVPAGAIKGITTWGSTCGACLTSVTDWGAAQFNPAAASVGTHTITYSFNPQKAGCPTYTTQVVITVTNPYNAAFVTPGPYCSNAGCATLTPSNTYTVGTGTWSGTGVSGSTFCPATSGVGSFPVTYTIGTSATCMATQTNTITVNAIPTANAGSPAVLTCTNTSAVLSGSGGSTYSWTGPAGGISSGANTATPTVTLVGTYTVLVANGTCTNTATVAVTQSVSPPSPTASSSSTITCTSTTAALNATGGASYSWSGTGIISGGNTATPVVNGAGPYVVTVTAANGCTATASTNVPQNVTPPTPTASNNTTLTCNTTSAVLTASGGGSYNWSGTGIISGGNTANPTVSGTGPYVVTVTAANGCTASASTNVVQNNTPPSPTASSSGPLTCTITTVTLTGTSGGSYVWSGPGIVSGGSTATPLVNLTGPYTVTVTAANGCTATANTTVTQNTVVPSLTMPATQTITCTAPTVTLIASSSPSNCNPVWTGGVTSGSGSFTATASSANNYTLTITDPANGCFNSGITQVVPSAGFPVVTTSASNDITCTTTTAQVVATTTSSPVSFSWAGSGITSGAATSTANVNASGQYTVVVQNTTSMCSSTLTVDVVLNNTPPSVSITTSGTNNGTITCTNTMVTITPTVSPSGSSFTYTWSASTGTITNQANATFTAAGVYTLAVTNTLTGCVSTSTNSGNTFTVTADNSVPTLSLATTGTVMTTCSSPNATLSASSDAGANAIYTWITPTSATITGNPLINSATGVYSVSVTNTLTGCTNTMALSQNTVEVVADSGTPSVTLTSNSLSITCSNPTPSLSITTNTTVTYNWTPTAGIVSGTETTATPSFSAQGTYSLVVTNNSSGCSTSVSGNVINVVLDNAPPVISLSSATNNGTITCFNPSVVATPTITSPSSNLTYTWSSGSGISTPVNQASATFTATGVYTLAVTNTLTGCVTTGTNSTNTFTVSIDTITPSATINVATTNSIIGCGASNGTVTLSSSITGTNNIITWLPNNVSSPTLDVTSANVYTLVVVDAINGCSVTPQYTVNGNTNPPQNVDAGTFAAIPCGTPTLALNGTTTSTDVVTYDWSGPNAGSIISPSNISNPVVMDAGVYTLTVTNSFGCSATATINVTQGNVVATFTASPTSGISPLVVAFTDGSIGATGFNWNFGDAATSSAQNPSHTFTTGTYTVLLTVTSGPCSDTATVVITVEDPFSIEIPNVFTPNNDGSNDIFTIKSTGVNEISLQVFSRWGQKLYEFAGPKASWDGLTPQGSQVPEGTYFYFVKATGFDGTEIEKNGTVNLFR